MSRLVALVLAAAMAIALVVACSSPRRGEPIAGAFEPSESAVRAGRTHFMNHCNKCHPGGEAGVGTSLNDKPLPAFLLRFQVRHGLGAMPSFSEEQLSDEHLDDLVDFVIALRRHG